MTSAKSFTLPFGITNKHLIGFTVLFLVYLSGSIWTILTPLILMIFMFIGHLVLNQESILYVPDCLGEGRTKPSENPPSFKSPKELRMDFQDVYLLTADNVTINAWWIRPNEGTAKVKQGFESVSRINAGKNKGPQGRQTILFCHANAGNMGIRNPNFHELYHRLNCNIFAFDYRGYGNSEGTPSEDGLMLDALACLQYLKKECGIDQCYIFGRSLGGAVCIATCKAVEDLNPKVRAEYPRIQGLMIENTFTSIPEVADKLFPFLTWPGISILKRIFCRLSWNSGERIKFIKSPILFLLGEKDEMIPPEHSKKLKENAVRSKDARIALFPNGTHNDTWTLGGDAYWAAFIEYMSEHH